MDIDAVDSADASVDFFDSDEVTDIKSKSLWFGREVTLSTEKNLKLQLLAQFFFANLQRAERVLQQEGWTDRFHFLDFQEEIIEEITENLDQYADFAYLSALYHPLNREFTLLDPKNYRADITECKNFLKASVKAIGHGAKKVGKVSKKAAKSVTKGAKKVVDFVKEHPKEIAIGLAIVAVGAGAYYLGSVAFAGAAAAGAGATSQGTAKRREDEEGHGSNTPLDSPPPPPKDPMPLSSFLSEQEKAHLNKSNPSSNLSANLSSSSSNTPPDKTYQFKNGISSLDLFKQGDKTNPSISGQPSSFNPPAPAPQGPSHLQSIISGFLQVAGKLVPNPINEAKTAIRDAKLVFTSPRSCHIETEGFKYLHLRIGFINGMNTTFEEAQSHLEHIRKFTGGMSVEGVYNHSNTALADAVEIFTLNYAGFAPRTAELLIENWTRFHEENINTPDAKYLQFAHSMGTILTRDALAQVPQEIRDRIIVVSIGPAVVISEDLCYKSIPYASENDPVHLGENLFAYITSGGVSNDNTETLEKYAKLVEKKKNLILLQPHPESEGMGHSFQDPVFVKIIEQNIKAYLDAGEY